MGGSGISGQAVLEGVLTKNDNKYALAVRKPNNDIEVLVERFSSISEKNSFFRLPFIRGVVSFVEELYLGLKNFSACGKFYEEENDNKSAGKNEALQILITIAVISLAIGLFIALPYGLSFVLGKFIASAPMLLLAEGITRLVLLVLFIIGISILPDIKKFYMYLGASHKVMNCVNKGIPLTISNVRRMGRKAYNCGTVFLLTVMFISILLFMFVRVDNTLLLILFRLLIVPVVAAFVYEIRELYIKSKNSIVTFFNSPALLIQLIISDEPSEDMIEVAIRSAAAVLGTEAEIEDIEKEPVKEVKKEKKKKINSSKAGIKRVSREKLENTGKNNKNKKDLADKEIATDKTEPIKEDKIIEDKTEKSAIKPDKNKTLAERTKSAVNNKEDKKVNPPTSEDEDDEILNALNHFFNSKKEEEKHRGKRK